MTRRILLPAIVLFLISHRAVIIAAPMPVTSFEKQPDGILVHSGSGTLRLTVWDSGILRVRYRPAGVMPFKRENGVIGGPRKTAWTVRNAPEGIYLSTDRFTARVNNLTGAISFLDRARHAILRELPQGGRTMTPVMVNGKAAFAIVQEFTRPPGERLFRMEETSELSSDTGGNHSDGAAPRPGSPTPLILSNKGYGLFWNSASRADFDPAEPPADSGKEPRKEPYRRKAFRSSGGEEIDYFFLYGPEWEQVLSGYDAVTGHS